MDKEIKKMLDFIHQTPGAYLGKKTLTGLVDLIWGYVACMYQRDGNMPDFLQGFQEYVEEYYHLKDNEYVFRNWSDIINFFCKTEEEAFDKFYKLLDEFETQRG